jgi:ABC-type uncharacterized transport system fused permease/ATPase subunit
MEEKASILELLLDRTVDYTKSSYELVKLKTVDKASDFVSSLVPGILVIILFSSFVLFVSLGLAFWLGNTLHNICFGFLIVAAFYGILTTVFRLFFYNRLKKTIGNRFIRKVLN